MQLVYFDCSWNMILSYGVKQYVCYIDNSVLVLYYSELPSFHGSVSILVLCLFGLLNVRRKMWFCSHQALGHTHSFVCEAVPLQLIRRCCL